MTLPPRHIAPFTHMAAVQEVRCTVCGSVTALTAGEDPNVVKCSACLFALAMSRAMYKAAQARAHYLKFYSTA